MPKRRRQPEGNPPVQADATAAPRRKVGRLRFCLRCVRRAALLPFLLLLGAYIYLNQAGLPEPLKRRLVTALRDRGVALEYGRMRLSLPRGIVAEGVTLAASNQSDGPEVTIPELTVRLDPAALCLLRFQLTGIEIQQGRVSLLLASTNEPTQPLIVDRVGAEIRFLPDDSWELTHLTARCLGAQLQLRAQLAHASALRNLRAPTPATTARTESPWQQPLRTGVRSIRAMKFSREPLIHLDARGDARDLASLQLKLGFDAHGAETEWGSLESLNITARLNEPTPQAGLGHSQVRLDILDLKSQGIEIGRIQLDANWSQSLTNPVPAAADWQLSLADIYTPWGETRQLEFSANGRQTPDDPPLLRSELRLTSGSLVAGMVRSDTNSFAAQLVHDGTSFLPRTADWRLEIARPQFAWGEASNFLQSGHLERRDPTDRPEPTTEWAWWRWLNPVRFSSETELHKLSVSNLVASRVLLAAQWDAPKLALNRIEIDMDGHQLQASASVDVGVRQLEASVRSDLDVKQLSPLLGAGGRKWLNQYSWESNAPPLVQGRAGFPLPPWSGIPQGWAQGFEQRLTAAGTVHATNAAFRGLPVATARLDVTHTNDIWQVRNLVATVPEGRVELDYTEHSSTKEYRFDVRSAVDPRVIKPLVPEEGRRAFDFFDFHEPPHLTGFVSGRWHSDLPPTLEAEIHATNFVFRNEPIEDFNARVRFANGAVSAAGISAHTAGSITVDGVGFELQTQRLSFTNAQSTVDPTRIARAIGTKVAQTLAPYQFSQPPQVRVDGMVNIDNTRDVNLRVELAGGPFRYWRFNVPEIQGVVTWSNLTVAVHNLDASFYTGRLQLDLDVDLAPGAPGVYFKFNGKVDDADAHTLVADLLNPTNTLRGRLTGNWIVTSADSTDMRSWQGFGDARLRDGFVMDVPLFGVVSDFVEGVVPGANLNKVTGLTATFTMTNSVLYTTDLKLPSPVMRLDYKGTIDFEGNVDARVESRLLRQAAVVGPVVSLLFSPLTKMLELRVTGTLGHPKTEPLYFPKPLLFPLNPIGTIKDMFSSDKEEKKEPPSLGP